MNSSLNKDCSLLAQCELRPLTTPLPPLPVSEASSHYMKHYGLTNINLY